MKFLTHLKFLVISLSSISLFYSSIPLHQVKVVFNPKYLNGELVLHHISL